MSDLIPERQSPATLSSYDLAYWHKLLTEERIVRPDYQRYDGVWDANMQSCLIESWLMGTIPVPSIYLEDGTPRSIVDGLQRLSTWHRFRRGKLRLRNLTRLPAYNDCRFDDLDDDDRRRLEARELNYIRVAEGHGREVFERLNHQVKIKPVEKTRAQYPGPGDALIDDLADEILAAVEPSRHNTLRKHSDDRRYALMGVLALLLERRVYADGRSPELGLGGRALRTFGTNWAENWLIATTQYVHRLSPPGREALRTNWLMTLRGVVAIFGDHKFERPLTRVHCFNALGVLLQFSLINLVGPTNCLGRAPLLQEIYSRVVITGAGRTELEQNYTRILRALQEAGLIGRPEAAATAAAAE